MAVTRSSFIKAMVKDSFPYAIESYDSVKKVRGQIFKVEDSDSAYTQYTSAIGPGSLTTVTEGTSIPRTSAQEGYTSYIANKKKAIELPLTNEAISDNQKIANYLKSWAEGLGESVANAQETDAAALFNYGGYTSGNAAFDNSVPGVISPSYGNFIYDGKPFFALTGNNHPAKNGSTYYNSIASLTLSGANLETIVKLMAVTNAFMESGLEMVNQPDTLLVQEGSENYYKAKRILESIGDMDQTHSGITNVWKGALTLIGWRFLNDADAFFVGRAKKGIVALSRLPLTVNYYNDENLDSQIVKAITRYGQGVTNFRLWAGANLSTS